ncbi:MAG: type II toxin-antitoxin system VapC family toxin [ANME-2 cluster archaeon]|nr:type II toxin-antitoxin system VapC family toxin [ANME-2 cluster archaeon]MBC2701846.1 type II toxin-antitoxin system VapC family toxin [ANME-2 cluster archaeon]MBC2707311.1 type II toxin-antitoxin system VapC family toxin [ANME-2 cluster archaeon]MBC2747170.1 type II toxin-antitoxin system VapC family toxin [ANME-2 cluster archaeon]MBC2761720.1 type II toxin-antitoxin system VapC family toxin [ANME-2 cluster archaeon]
MNYLDSNLVIYAILDDTELGEWSRGVLESVQNAQMPACTSFLTFDEVFYKVNKIKGIDIAIKNLEAFLSMPNIRFIDVSDIIIWKALELIKEYKLLPRDGIHAATAFIAGAETIISQDADFDNIKGLKRKWMI